MTTAFVDVPYCRLTTENDVLAWALLTASNRNAYGQADLVTYLSSYEGFGNAFLEAIYYRRPLVCNRYTIYRTDIDPCGFRIPVIEGFLTDKFVNEARRVLEDNDYRRTIVKHNYEVGSRFFSYDTVRRELLPILYQPDRFFHMSGPRKQ